MELIIDLDNLKKSNIFVEEYFYLQFLANNYGWTTPDIRIHYLNGDKKEIFTLKED